MKAYMQQALPHFGIIPKLSIGLACFSKSCIRRTNGEGCLVILVYIMLHYFQENGGILVYPQPSQGHSG